MDEFDPPQRNLGGGDGRSYVSPGALKEKLRARTFRRGGVLGVGGQEVVEVYAADTRSRIENIRRERSSRSRGSEAAPAAVEAIAETAAPAAESRKEPAQQKTETRDGSGNFSDALSQIRQEIREVEEGAVPREDNLLVNAPHTLQQVVGNAWTRPYDRERAGFPSPQVRESKVWPTVGRIDGAYGDRNLICTCVTMEELAGA